MKLNIDRTILRDIMEARATNERRNSYYVVGSIFSGMSFTMLLLGSDNYTAISTLVMVGMIFYSCISCNKIDFEEIGGVSSDSNQDQEEDQETYMKVGEMTLDEKINLFKELFYELSNIHLEDEELERMLTTVNYAEEEEIAEESAEDKSGGEESAEDKSGDETETTEENPEKNNTEKVIEQLRKVEEDTQARNLARAETYYSEGEPATENTN